MTSRRASKPPPVASGPFQPGFFPSGFLASGPLSFSSLPAFPSFPTFPGFPSLSLNGKAWPSTQPWSSLMSGLGALPPLGQAPRFDLSIFSDFLELQRRCWQLWVDSAQTIALRFMLAPPWMAASPWVREEWVKMTAEKVAASTEAINAAAIAGLRPDSYEPKAFSRTAHSVLAPFSSRTRSNATRLGSRALRSKNPLAAAMPAARKVALAPAALALPQPKPATKKRRAA